MKRFLVFYVFLMLSMVAFAQGFQSLSVNDFAKKIGQKGVFLMDVRTVSEYQQGHLEGATNVVWDKNFEQSLKAYSLDSCEVAVYCRSGRRSKMAAEVLVRLGFRVVELDRGILGWMAEKMPVTNDVEKKQ